MRFKLILTLTFTCLVLALKSQTIVKARLLDKTNGDAVPFANIKTSPREGTISDVNGYFKLNLPSGYSGNISISHVSYETIFLSISDLQNRSNIYLTPLTTDLGTVVVNAEENPADAVIRKAIAARNSNDPTRLRSYQYNSYNKFLFTIEGKDGFLDSIKRVTTAEQRRSLDAETQGKLEVDSIQDEHHLFLSESVTEKKFLKPNRHYEKVLTTKTSGFKVPFLTTLATSFQPFTFYEETITILNSDFVNPVSPGTFSRYYFDLVETSPNGTDSLYVIKFSPLKNRDNLLSGILYIESGNHAIERVIAKGSSPILETDFNIRQLYKKIDNAWFPAQLYTDFLLNETDELFSNKRLKVISDSYISNVQIAPSLKASDLKKVAIEYATTTEIESETLLTEFRNEVLTRKETRTYEVLDSIMSQPKLTWINKALEAFATSYYPIGWVDLELKRILAFNDYEGFRLGIGLRTNEKVSKSISLGGYWAYGLRDKNLKFGGDLTYIFNQPESFIKLAYIKDFFEQGQERSPYKRVFFRNYVSSRFNSYEGVKATISKMISRPLVFNTYISNQTVTARYPYAFDSPSDFDLQSQFDFTETGAQLTYHPAKYARLGNRFIKSSSQYPFIKISYAKGWSDFWDGGFDYQRLDFNLENEFKYRAGGRLKFQINAGYVEGDVPYPLLFTGHGTSTSDFFAFGYFQTMRPYEFTSDQYVNIFIGHTFGSYLWKNTISSPVIELHQNIGIGNLSSAERHREIDVNIPSQPYLESGIKLNRIINLDLNDAKYNINIGVFYRYGVHALDTFGDNIFFTLDIN
ncbi:DUF5686 family protein [Roseivirga misakiensis]|uniref:Carboxypeptidase-like regulatory domain-containing protein n=1 Tax=Roseivirga misakiensis TaxID=1563681 RepID=A0A1E5SZP1_9BACT|nr:DUF5686 family protein [Roseivirga misakiensis]OEK04600.1 hypothetical protein BFP71_14155 [Roseivirga misakiensis]